MVEEKLMTQFNSVEEMMNDMKKNYNWWDKFILNPKMNWLRWLIYNAKDVPMDNYRAIKWFIQRGKRGYSDRDVWGFNWHLSEVIIQGLMDLKKQLHGCPCGMIGTQSIETEEEPSEAMKEWKHIIETMIWTFKASRKIQDHTWLPVFDERRRPKFEKWIKKLKDPDKDPLFKDVKLEYYLMTKKDMIRYEEGWKNFKKYYFDLWD